MTSKQLSNIFEKDFHDERKIKASDAMKNAMMNIISEVRVLLFFCFCRNGAGSPSSQPAVHLHSEPSNERTNERTDSFRKAPAGLVCVSVRKKGRISYSVVCRRKQ